MNISIVTIKDYFAKFGKNLTWIFFAAFLILLLLEIFEIKKSVDIGLNLNKEPVVVKGDKGVRINFEEYEKALKRIKDTENFVPTDSVLKDPFVTQITGQ